MTRRFIQGLIAVFVSLLVISGLTGCGLLSAAPPKEVVAQAVTIQAQANQKALWQRLSLKVDAPPSLSVNQVKIHRTRPVKVASMSACEVTGSYRYKLRYPSRRKIEQSQVPFTVVLREVPDTENWQLLRIDTDARGDRTWLWEPLMSDRA